MDKKGVVPGSHVGTEEEFIAGSGTFVEDAGIYSTLLGELGEEQKTLSVRSKVMLHPIHAGVEVLGRVENIVEPIALVSIIPLAADNARYTEVPDYCVLHASRVKEGFVKNIRGEFRIGDIIRAKVIDLRNSEVSLSTEGQEHGVVKAYCSKCRNPLVQMGAQLSCTECGAVESRKLSRNYRKLEV